MSNTDIGPQIKLQLDQMITNLSSIKLTSPLTWLWVWDTIVDNYNRYADISDDVYNDCVISEGTTLDMIFERLYANPPADFTLQYGTDQLDEAITDWLIDQEFIVALDDDGWWDESIDIEEEEDKS